MITYRAMLDVPTELVAHVASLLAANRRARGTRLGTRQLSCRSQAVFVLVWFRERRPITVTGKGFGISQATAYRYLHEAIDVLAAQAPDLRDALERVAADVWSLGRGGQISLGGLTPREVLEVLVGLQQRCRIDRVRTKEGDLRAVVDDLRRQQVQRLADYVVPEAASLAFKGVANSLTSHARRALASTETEVSADEWDLALFGHPGTVSFTSISQQWLREAAKRWAAEDLPRRRVRAGRRTSDGLAVRHHIGAVARLSESLRMRPDRGQIPAARDRADNGGLPAPAGVLGVNRAAQHRRPDQGRP